MKVRNARAIELAKQLPYLPPVPVWRRVGNTKWSGWIEVQAGCPGINGKPCATRSRVKKNSVNGRCEQCRNRLVWDGLVSAAQARLHIKRLARQRVGRRAIEAVSDIPHSTIQAIKRGTKKQIRFSTEQKILAVTVVAARGNKSLLSSDQTYKIIDWLLSEGLRPEQIRKRIGLDYQFPILVRRRPLITARIALKIQRYFLSIFVGDEDGPPRYVFLEKRAA